MLIVILTCFLALGPAVELAALEAQKVNLGKAFSSKCR